MEDESWNFIMLWLTAIASLCYCYLVSSNLSEKKLRFLLLFPLLAIFTFFPFTLSAGVPPFFFSWLANFKLLLFSFGSGLLIANAARQCFCMFIAFACLPIRLWPHSCAETNTTSLLRLNWSVKLILFVLLTVAGEPTHSLPPKFLTWGYSKTLYDLIDVIVGLCIYWVQILVGIDSPFNQPNMSTSLQWRRWKLIVTVILRHTIYQSLRWLVESTIGIPMTTLKDLVGMSLVFGMIKNLFYLIIRVVGSRCRLNRVLWGLATVAFVLVSATLWFTSPLVRNGADVKVGVEYPT